jgi:glycosyltransferase 2 family protein
VIEEVSERISHEEEQAARSTLGYVWRFVAVLLVLAGLGFAIVKQVGHLPQIDWHFSAGWLVLAVVCFALLQFIHAGIWRLILRCLHGHVESTRSRAIWSTSNMGKYVPTSLLAWVMRITMADRVGVPRRVTGASLVYEVALLVTACTVIGAYGVIQLPDLHGESVRWLVVLAPVAALIALHPRVFQPVADIALKRAGREPLPTTLSVAQNLMICAAYAASLLVAGAGTYSFAHALHPVSSGDIPTVVAAFAIGLGLSFIGFILPAGIGAREAGFTAALAPALPTGVALAVAVGVRLLQMAIEVVYALVTPVIAARRSESAPVPPRPTARRAR